MKDIPIVDAGRLKNELAKYKKGKKLDIRLFNQVAPLAWLGKIVLCPLDPEDPECKAWLLHLQPLDGLAAEIIRVDEDLNGQPFASQIDILDAERARTSPRFSAPACRTARATSRRWRSAISISRNIFRQKESPLDRRAPA